MMKKVLTAILILSSVFACTVFAADPINIPIKANVPDGSGETTPPDGSITVNGITLQFAIKGINDTDKSVPESWGAEGEGTNWQDIGSKVPTVYADLTGEVNKMTVDSGEVYTYDSFYVCLQALGNNLSTAATAEVTFSAANNAMTHDNVDTEAVTLVLTSTPKNSNETSDNIYFTNEGNTFTVHHPGKKIDAAVYGGYCHVSWEQSTARQAGDYSGTIIVTVTGDTNPTE